MRSSGPACHAAVEVVRASCGSTAVLRVLLLDLLSMAVCLASRMCVSQFFFRGSVSYLLRVAGSARGGGKAGLLLGSHPRLFVCTGARLQSLPALSFVVFLLALKLPQWSSLIVCVSRACKCVRRRAHPMPASPARSNYIIHCLSCPSRPCSSKEIQSDCRM